MASDALAVAGEVFTRLRPGVERAAEWCCSCLRGGGKILVCGNGGSAADAQHLSAELVNRFLRNRRPYAAVALTTDPSVLTSIGNDFGFELVFQKQVEALGRPGDVLIVFSTSGESANILRAAEAARSAGLRVLAITGRGGGALAGRSDLVLSVESADSTPRIQEGHLYLLHTLCQLIEERMDG